MCNQYVILYLLIVVNICMVNGQSSSGDDEAYWAFGILGALAILFIFVCADVIHKRFQNDHQWIREYFEIGDNSLIGRNPNDPQIVKLKSEQIGVKDIMHPNNNNNNNAKKDDDDDIIIVERKEEEEKDENKETLNKAWNSDDDNDDDDDIDEEEQDKMGDMQSVRIEVNRRSMQTGRISATVETPQSTRL